MIQKEVALTALLAWARPAKVRLGADRPRRGRQRLRPRHGARFRLEQRRDLKVLVYGMEAEPEAKSK